MEYLEFLEHMETLLRASDAEMQRLSRLGTFAPRLITTVQSEIQNERRRGELALHLTQEPRNEPPTQNPPNPTPTARPASS